MRHSQTNKGFTLIELSIVLVIIGLLVGGILTGKALIYQASLRHIVTEKETFETAVNTFFGKYNCLPGDCATATTFFGSAGGNGSWQDSTCANAAAASFGQAGTCNGDGDNKIGTNAGYGGFNSGEQYGIWQHLALAKMIPGQYTAQGQVVSYAHIPGVNSPISTSFPNAIWAVVSISSATDALAIPTGAAAVGQHLLIFGASYYNPGGYWGGPVGFFNAPDAYLIDSKYDDGMPYTGSITVNAAAYYAGGAFGGNPCSTSPLEDVSSTTVYAPNAYWSSSTTCMLLFTLKMP